MAIKWGLVMPYQYGDHPTKKEIFIREKESKNAEKIWLRTVGEWREKSEKVKLCDADGKPFWYVITPHLLNLMTNIAKESGFLEGLKLSSDVTEKAAKKATDFEAYYSSHIEGAASSLEAALDFMRKNHRYTLDESLQMIVNNRIALEYAAQQIGKPVTNEMICELQYILTENTHKDHPITRGSYRHGPVYIVNSMGEVVYEGPHYLKLSSLMDSFISWINEESSIHPIIKAGITHLYFVQVHPFDDGNGRTARALSDIVLANAGLRFINMLSLSDYFDHKRPRYYKAIQDVRGHDLDLTYFLIFYSEALLTKLKEVKSSLEREKRSKNLKEMLPIDLYKKLNRRQLKAMGVMAKTGQDMTTKLYLKLNRCSDETARKDFLQLIELGLMKSEGKGRSTRYILK